MTVINKDGGKREFDFAELAVPEPMQRSLATVFAAQSRGWTSHLTAKTHWYRLVVFTRFLSRMENPPEDLGDLTPAMLKRWRAKNIGTGNGRDTLWSVRALLQLDPRLATGSAAEELARRVPSPRRSKQSYGATEREQVQRAAQRTFRSALLRIRENTRLLESWQAGELALGSREWRIGEVLDHLACTGDVPRTISPGGRAHVKNKRLLGGEGPRQTWSRLFLTRMELTSLAVLLTDRFGWNMSVYDRMPTPTTAPSVGEVTSVTYQVQLEKRRAGIGRWFSTENITDSGADSPGRLITHALEVTAHGRVLAARLATGMDLLMVARTYSPGMMHRIQLKDRPRPVGPLVFGIAGGDAHQWGRVHGLGESPFQRTRRTTVTREGRPLQHAQHTHESVYVLPDEQVQHASREIFEAAALEALAQAQQTVFTGQITDDPDPGHQETAVADCVDETTSPWPAPDGGCAAGLLLCLGCRNAHVHPSHHPRLTHLHQQLQSLKSALPEPAWRERWHDHLLRLDDLRDKIGPAAWSAALSRVCDSDRAVVRLLMRGELTP